MSMMQIWSTEHLPRRDRFEYWREERARRLFGVEAEIAPERRLDFTGRIAVATAGAATVAEVAVTSYTMRRTQRAIDRAPDRSLYVRHLVRGGGLTISGATEEHVRGGAVSSGLSDVPYTNMPDASTAPPNDLVIYRAVKIPLAILPALPLPPERLGAHQHKAGSGLDVLLSSYLASFLEQVPYLDAAAAERAVQILAQLTLAARGAGDPRGETAAAAIRQGVLVRARRLVERDLHRADFTPAAAAAALGISLRKLHLVFEPTGQSFSRYVTARRLARADGLLASEPAMPVTEIAYACGFDSLSTFFRRYRAAYGASPGDRHAASRGA